MGIVNFKSKRKNNRNKSNIFEKNRTYNKNFENLTKSERLMEGVGIWCSFYRANPHRFVEEYLQIRLKKFQCIILYFMMHFNYVMYLAARGQGKTTLTAIFCCVRCILMPETKIICASGNIGQAIEVLEKISDFKKQSPNLAREISELKTNKNDARCEFHNGSWIKVVASNDGARSKRANIILIDEFRMVSLDVINKVLRKFLTAPRTPKYLSKPEYAHLAERNKEIYLTSCWYKSHWSYDKMIAFYKSMIKGKKYFLCGLPYQLSVSENLLMKEQVLDEMSEDDFDEISWSMEMECKWFGEADKAYFKFNDLDCNRRLNKAIYPRYIYDFINDNKFKYIQKEKDEIRFISCDIAGMGGNANDASAFIICRLIPKTIKMKLNDIEKTKKIYMREVCYMETMVGEHSVTQALRIRELKEEFECDYIVIDTQSFGLGVYDQLCMDLYDRNKQIEYKAISCMNNEEMASRCLVSDAPKVIYSIKANKTLNSDGAIGLKDDLKRNKIKLLVNEMNGQEYLKSLKNYNQLSAEEKARIINPYVQTTALVNEMINLSNRGEDGIVQLKENSGRKDRYSALLYMNIFARYLEKEILKQNDDSEERNYVFY